MPWPIWIEAILNELSLEPRAELRDVLLTPGAPWGRLLNDHLVHGELTQEAIIRISNSFESAHRSHTPNTALVAALPQLRREGFSLHLWISNTRATAIRILNELNIQELFSTVVAREDVFLGKPDREGRDALHLKNEARNKLLVGDSQNDQMVAAMVGIDYDYFLRSFHRRIAESFRHA